MNLSSIGTVSSTYTPGIPYSGEPQLIGWFDPNNTSSFNPASNQYEWYNIGQGGYASMKNFGTDADYLTSQWGGVTITCDDSVQDEWSEWNGSSFDLTPLSDWTVVTFQGFTSDLDTTGTIIKDTTAEGRMGCYNQKKYWVEINTQVLDMGDGADTQFHMFSIVKTASTVKSYVNKTERLNISNPGVSGFNGFLFYPSFEQAYGQLGPILIYSTALTESDIESIFDYYKNRYSI